jgi:DNA-binding LytR/AlgR family response regulator
MGKLKILIVEDELLIAEDIRMHLIKMDYEVTDTVVSYHEAIDSIMSNLPDLVLVDINIDGKKDGIELGKFIREEAELPFIYLTSHADKATVARAKVTQPNAYLLKPFKPESLYTSIEMALSHASMNLGADADNKNNEELFFKDSLFVKKNQSYVKLKIQDIALIKSEGNYLYIFDVFNERHIIRSTIKNFLDHLPENSFFQTHKSYIINLNELKEVNPNIVVLNKHEAPISKSRHDVLIKRIKTVK